MTKAINDKPVKKTEDKRRPTITEYTQELEAAGRLTDAVREAVIKAVSLKDEFHTTFYLAGGLTGMSDEVKERYVSLSDLIVNHDGMFGYAPHLHGTDPIVHPLVTPEEVRDIDYLFAVVVPDYHINCWYPIAHGNAVEAGWAEMANIPVVHLVPEGITLSRLVRGMRNIAVTITYKDFNDDGLAQVRQFLSK